MAFRFSCSSSLFLMCILRWRPMSPTTALHSGILHWNLLWWERLPVFPAGEYSVSSLFDLKRFRLRVAEVPGVGAFNPSSLETWNDLFLSFSGGTSKVISCIVVKTSSLLQVLACSRMFFLKWFFAIHSKYLRYGMEVFLNFVTVGFLQQQVFCIVVTLFHFLVSFRGNLDKINWITQKNTVDKILKEQLYSLVTFYLETA